MQTTIKLTKKDLLTLSELDSKVLYSYKTKNFRKFESKTKKSIQTLYVCSNGKSYATLSELKTNYLGV